jgi:hypothetical protein
MKNLCTHASGHISPATVPVTLNSQNRKAFSRRPNNILVTLLSVSLLLLSQFSTAQAPQQFSFQGAARGADGKILANKSITVIFDIHQGNSNGPVVFSEVHSASTNANGIFNLQIGTITDMGSMSNMNWETNSYFLQTAMLYDGLPAVVDLGTTQLLSVPYALSASKSIQSEKADTALVAKKWVDDEPVVQVGSEVTGSLLPDVPSGNVLIWYSKKAAFRVGKHSGNSWNRTNIGTGSFASGIATIASGDYSASFGTSSEATGSNSFSAGSGSKASGNNSISMGYSSISSATGAISVGASSEAQAQNAVAIGESSIASGVNSVVIGEGSFSSGENAVAIGHQTNAFGQNSVSLGYRTAVKSFGAFAAGIFNNTSDSPNSTSPGSSDRLFQIGNGVSNISRSNALTILRNGNIGIGNDVLTPEYIMDIGGRLRVRHNVTTAGIYFNNSQNQEEGFVGMKTDAQIGFYCNNQWQFWVDNNAAYWHGAALQVSDIRLKTNIVPFSKSSLLALSNLKGYHYNWLDTKRSQSRQTGLIAQEVERYFPLLVNTDKDGYKAVNYTDLIPHLIEAVKELDKRTEEIAGLKKELAEMKEINKRMTALEAGLKSLLTENKSAIGKSQAK